MPVQAHSLRSMFLKSNDHYGSALSSTLSGNTMNDAYAILGAWYNFQSLLLYLFLHDGTMSICRHVTQLQLGIDYWSESKSSIGVGIIGGNSYDQYGYSIAFLDSGQW